MTRYQALALIIAASCAPGIAIGQGAKLGGLDNGYQQFDGIDDSGLQDDPLLLARQKAMAEASEPAEDAVKSTLEFAGSLTLGVNNENGGYGRATIVARQRNIGGSNVSVGVSLSKGID